MIAERNKKKKSLQDFTIQSFVFTREFGYVVAHLAQSQCLNGGTGTFYKLDTHSMVVLVLIEIFFFFIHNVEDVE